MDKSAVRFCKAQLGRGGRIDVQPDFTIPGFPGVYALGDFANMSEKDGTRPRSVNTNDIIFTNLAVYIGVDV